MIRLHYKSLPVNDAYEKNKLYKIFKSRDIQFVENQDGYRDAVNLEYILENEQYGFFAYEYKSPVTKSKSVKAADVLACAIDKQNKKIYTTIFDVKHNISAFSSDLFKADALITAINNVLDFVEQIHVEILHKNSFMIFFLDDGYEEEEHIGIATLKFDSDKFIKVSELLDKIFQEDSSIPQLVSLKLQNDMSSYRGASDTIRNFATRIVEIGSCKYSLDVFLLKEISDCEFETAVKIQCGT